MRRSLTQLSLCASLAAFTGPSAYADIPLDRFATTAGGISAVASEVPLYGSPGDGTGSFVVVQLGEDTEALFELGTSSRVIEISEDLAGELDLKVKSRNRKRLNLHGEDHKWRLGGEVKQATIEHMALGEVVLEDVRVQVGYSNKNVDGRIGLGALTALSWAVLPSEGIVRVGPAGAGSQWTADLGAKGVPFHEVESYVLTVGPRGQRTDVVVQGAPYVVPSTLGGLDARTAVILESCDAKASTALTLREGPTWKEGNVRSNWLAIQFGDADTVSSWFLRDSGFEMEGVDVDVDSQVCAGELARFDLVLDHSGGTLAFSRIQKAKKQNPDGDILTDLEDALVAADEAAPEDEEQGKKKKGDADAEEPDGPDPAALRALADEQVSQGFLTSAMDIYGQLVELEPNDCSALHALGNTQRDLGEFEWAITSLTKASEQYHAWWDMDLETRGDLEKELEKLEEGEEPPHHVQAASCHQADTDLSRAYLAAGDHASVEKLYRSYLDLDSGLAMVYASSHIQQGNWDAVQEPLRQALRMNRASGTVAATRAGLGLAYAQSGDWSTASGHFTKALAVDDLDTRVVEIWLDGLREAEGQEGAVKAATRWAAARPDSYAALYGLAREAARVGDQAALDAASALMDGLYDDVVTRGSSARQKAAYAQHMVLIGKLVRARTVAERAIDLEPSLPSAWLALARVDAAEGKHDEAGKNLTRARALGADHPGYASLSLSLASESTEDILDALGE
ncbi:MAG: hypothetical protein QGG40_00455 [Myxococcota bacterium]|nr:hypothetical protein [Myxococcota bacterium]